MIIRSAIKLPCASNLLLAGGFILSLCCLFPTFLNAAAVNTPWSETGVLLAGAIPLDSPDELEEQWSGGAGMTAILSTPIYPGYLDAGVLLTMNKARDELTPDFLIRYLFLGWDWYVSLPGSFQGFAGVHCGNCNFLFDDTDVTDPQKSESEFAAGFSTGGKYSFSENWLLACNLRQTTVFTRRRIHLTHLIVGVEYRFDNPDWLRGLLR